MDLSVAVYPYGARPLFQVTTYVGPLLYPEYLAPYYKPYGGKLRNILLEYCNLNE